MVPDKIEMKNEKNIDILNFIFASYYIINLIIDKYLKKKFYTDGI